MLLQGPLLLQEALTKGAVTIQVAEGQLLEINVGCIPLLR